MNKKLDFSRPLVVLAPLAGYTDLPFRSVVKKFGADLTISEMISSNALVYKSARTLKMFEKFKKKHGSDQISERSFILCLQERLQSERSSQPEKNSQTAQPAQANRNTLRV